MYICMCFGFYSGFIEFCLVTFGEEGATFEEALGFEGSKDPLAFTAWLRSAAWLPSRGP